MRGRIMHVTLKKELLDEAIKAWPTYTKNFRGRGMVAQFMFVDRETCQVRSVTVWESQEILAENERRPELPGQLSTFERFYADKPYWTYYDIPGSWADIERLKALVGTMTPARS